MSFTPIDWVDIPDPTQLTEEELAAVPRLDAQHLNRIEQIFSDIYNNLPGTHSGVLNTQVTFTEDGDTVSVSIPTGVSNMRRVKLIVDAEYGRGFTITINQDAESLSFGYVLTNDDYSSDFCWAASSGFSLMVYPRSVGTDFVYHITNPTLTQEGVISFSITNSRGFEGRYGVPQSLSIYWENN